MSFKEKKTFRCVSVSTKTQLRIVFLLLMEVKNRNTYFKALLPQTEIVLKQFLCLWSYILSLQVKPSSFPRLPNQKERTFVTSKSSIPRDKIGFPSAKEMVWGTDLGSGHNQDARLHKDTQAIDTEEKTRSFLMIQVGFSQNIVSLSSIIYCLDFH